MTRVTIDIQHFERQYTESLRRLDASDIGDRNKHLVHAFCDACLLHEVCGKVRLGRVVSALMVLARYLRKDYDTVTRADLERLLGMLLQRQPAYSPETISAFKKILKRFLGYVFVPSEFPQVKKLPEHVAWISARIRRGDRPTVKRSDLLIPDDVERLIRGTTNERDRAFVAMLWEAGPRVSEIGNRQIKHVMRNALGYTVELTGKTGTRSPLLVSSAPYLSAWLSVHPYADDPEAPLWVQRHRKEAVSYPSIKQMLQRLFRRVGISKPSHPHIFRHSRVTWVLANGIFNEQQCKVFFGWAANSDMPGSTYAHLIDTDVNNAILRENGLAPQQQRHRELQPVTCHICQTLNAPRAEYCQKCNAVLDLKKAYEHQQLHDLKEDLFAKMFKLLVDRGMIDEAAREIHDANLGSTLKRLAQHATGERNIAATAPIVVDAQPVNQNTPTVKENNST